MQTLTLETYYLTKPEPYQSCLLALRDIILRLDAEIIHERKFQIPFFTYRGKKLAYLWLDHKKLKMGFCLDKSLQQPVGGAKPKDQYESILIDPNQDLPLDLICQKLNVYINQIKNL
ncbi:MULTISPECIES: DUF1801 domain-containing protein [unclassified Mucilaginibacter]|uniref:DUF1801 domain-containing protein n=1 Tax=unclassified Mucilaginibacter TaxID=2617802 RepID=UPI002AC8B3F1|nr:MULTISPECIES: DUF1801 domain-containing protein [unclassified Mucilaginibacter]MEB0263156.1 DUF1801 domain-containing protein [Mucilaginibacter sp. 10I4]MEB0278126.1 DUF1801 domain-containing protein [Mucilaginibacter sp. 10B2]MEB0301360.1 DUF1801 domain-containing protein [Mucilaginibacter sp. 5C4]WPX23038.1 DUF1801 domain-containing protein [Mucilaginibacter sp. 5C4]